MATKPIPVPKYGQTVVDTMGRSGVAKFDPNTGKPLTAPQTSTVPKPATAPQNFANAREASKSGQVVSTGRGYFENGKYNVGTAPKVSTTTISNLNKKNEVPKIAKTLQEYDTRGMVSDGQTIKYPDGAIFEEEQTVSNSDIENDYKNSPEYQLLQQMRQSLDSQTASQIAGIQQQVEDRRREVNEYSQQQTKAYERSMLMGGATGKGSQQQFAPGSVQGVLSAQEKYRIKQISDLDRQEVQLINSAKEAQRDGDFRFMAQQIELIKGLRKQKQEEVAKANEEIAKRNQKLRDQIYQTQRDNAVADLYQQGITSTSDIFQALQDAGGDFTIDEINETLQKLVPPGLDDLVETLSENGAPTQTIQNVLKSRDLSEAYKASGLWASKGTGNVAEYNKYQAQSVDSGVIPLGYQDWVDYNENQKLQRQKALKTTSAKKVSGKSTGTVPVVETTYQSDPFVQKLQKTSGGSKVTDTTIQKLDKGLSVLGQLGVLQENIENQKTGPLAGAFRSKNPWDNEAQVIKAQLNAIVPNLARGIYGEVGVLTDNDIAQYSKTIPNLKSTEEVRDAVMYITLDMIGKSIKNTLNVNASAGRDVSGFIDIYTEMENTKNNILQTIPGANVPESIKQSNTESLINKQKAVASNINNVYKTLTPRNQDMVDSLYVKGYNDVQVEEYLKLKGLIQ